MSWALSVPVGGNEKVMLLGLANHAHPDGSEAYPSLDTLAIYGHCGRSTARRNVRKLVEDGWVQEDGEGPKGTLKYQLCLWRTAADSEGVKMTPGGVTGDTGGVSPMTPEPSIEPTTPTAKAVGPPEEIDEPSAATLNFCRFLADQATKAAGVERKVEKKWYEPAADLLGRVPKDELAAVVKWAHTRPYWVTRVRTMPELRKQWPRVRAEWNAAQTPKSSGKTGAFNDRNARRLAALGASHDER